MGNNQNKQINKWQVQAKVVVAKESLPLPDPFQDPARLVSSSQLVESPDSSRLVASPSALVPVPQCTSLPSLSTSLLRSSSSPVTPPRTTRRPESFPPHPVGHQKRRGIEQAPQQHHYRCWWCPPQHPRFPHPPKEGREERQLIALAH